MSGGEILALALVLAAIYLLAIRLIDLNEKEPSWALALMFAVGLAAGAALPTVVSSPVLEASTYRAAFAKDFAKLLALCIGFVVLLVVRRQEGWFEVSGVIDGIVYGATLGLGFSTGLVAVLYRTIPTSPALGGEGTLSFVMPLAAAGLSQGLFGGIMGAGFGAARYAGSLAGRVLLPLVGFLAAFSAHASYLVLVRGDALAGTAAVVRTWTGLGIPVAFLLALFLHGIQTERRAIAEELASDESAVTEPLSVAARRVGRLATLARGDIRAYVRRRKIHNRQVMLALAKRRAKRQKNSERRSGIEEEVRHLRASILQLTEELERGESSP